jgi:stress response protein SCP2
VPDELGRVLVTATITGGIDGADDATFADVAGLEIVVGTARAGSRPVHFVVPPLGEERSLLVAEIYRRQGRWRVRAIAQGYAEGRAGLARDFGVAVG